MSYFTALVELWILLLLCIVVGRRIAGLLPPLIQDSVGFYIEPILGLAALLLLVTLFGWNLPFKSEYTLAATFSLVLLAIILEKKLLELMQRWLRICLFASLCSLPILAPALIYQGYSPFTDIFTYLVHSQWLQTHAFSEKVFPSGYYPYLTQIALYQGNGSRMGASFLLGYVQSLFHLKWSYYAYLPAVSLAFVSGCLALGGVIRQIIQTNQIVILALAAIPCCSLNGFIFGAEWGFYPQTFGLAFAAGFAALFPLLTQVICNENYKWSELLFYAFPLALCSAAFLFAYNEPFPLFAIGLLLFVLIVAFIFKNKMKTLLFFYSVYFIHIVALLNYEALRIARNLLTTLSISKGGANIGWPVLWSPIQLLAHAFGMKSPIDPLPTRLDYFLSTFIFPIFLVAFALILIRFMRKNPKKNLALIFLLSANAALFLFIIKFRYLSPNASSIEMGQTFLQYKITEYATPFSLALMGVVLAILWQDNKKLRPFFAITYTFLVAVSLSFQSVLITKCLIRGFTSETQREKDPFRVFLKLRSAMAKIPKNKPVYLAFGIEHQKLRQMVSYILYDRKMASDYRDDNYILSHLPPDQQVIEPLEDAEWITINTKSRLSQKNSHLIGPFEIHHRSEPVSYLLLTKSEGGCGTKINREGDSQNLASSTLSHVYSVLGKVQEVKFSFRLHSFPLPRLIVAKLKDSAGNLLARYELPKQDGNIFFKTPWLRVNSDQVILTVEADGKPVRLSEHDPRQVAFMITNLKTYSR